MHYKLRNPYCIDNQVPMTIRGLQAHYESSWQAAERIWQSAERAEQPDSCAEQMPLSTAERFAHGSFKINHKSTMVLLSAERR